MGRYRSLDLASYSSAGGALGAAGWRVGPVLVDKHFCGAPIFDVGDHAAGSMHSGVSFLGLLTTVPTG